MTAMPEGDRSPDKLRSGARSRRTARSGPNDLATEQLRRIEEHLGSALIEADGAGLHLLAALISQTLELAREARGVVGGQASTPTGPLPERPA